MVETKAFKDTMFHIYKIIDGEKKYLKEHDISTQGASEEENIDVLLQRTRRTIFKLLVMGRFSSGKSAFINVLLGEKILPENALPSTALITEIYYSKKKRVTMYPKKGKWKGGDEPFDIEPTLSEIAKYSTIDNKGSINKKEANRVDSCFEKMVVYWPLELLKEGVVIVDSPGTDDPYSNDYIVQEYVPKADMVVYCINGTQAYGGVDKKTLQNVNSIGFSNPIMLTTYFDVVTADMNVQEKNNFVDVCNHKYSSHTHTEFCHYINSKQGMEAKRSGSQSALVESGYYELEKFLTKYLTENKGREKAASATSAVKAYNKGQKKTVKSIMANVDMPLDDFNCSIGNTEKKLEQARRQGELIVREFRIELKSTREEVKSRLIPMLYQGLCNQISLDDFEPDTSFTIWHPKRSSQQIAEECSKEIEVQNKRYIADWSSNVLMPVITRGVQDAASRTKLQFDAFERDIRDVRLTLDAGAADVQTDINAGTRAAMVVYALVTGDWITALMGGIFGVGAFGRTVVCQFVAGIVVSIISLFTPVGLPALVIASIGGLIAGQGWNIISASKSIKRKAVEETLRILEQQKEEILMKASAECEKIFDDLEGRIRQAVNDDITEIERQIREILREREKSALKVAERKEELAGVLHYLDQVDAKMDEIRQNFGIE